MAYIISVCALPAEFTGIFADDPDKPVHNWQMFFCVAAGLWGGLIIGLVTEYFTSNRFVPVQVCARGGGRSSPRSHPPTPEERSRTTRRALALDPPAPPASPHIHASPTRAQDVADACRTGAATDIIFGLALGYKSGEWGCVGGWGRLVIGGGGGGGGCLWGELRARRACGAGRATRSLASPHPTHTHTHAPRPPPPRPPPTPHPPTPPPPTPPHPTHTPIRSDHPLLHHRHLHLHRLHPGPHVRHRLRRPGHARHPLHL